MSPPRTTSIETTSTCRFEPSPELPHHLTRRARTAHCGKPLRARRGRGQESGREKARETTDAHEVETDGDGHLSLDAPLEVVRSACDLAVWVEVLRWHE